jgi:hypothetical protein
MISGNVERFQGVLEAYVSISGENEADAATDLVADLLHWCVDRGVAIEDVLAQANLHFVEESYADFRQKQH